MEKWLLEHLHFKKKKEGKEQNGYHFNDDWVIYMDKEFNPFKYKPFDWDRPGYAGVNLQEAPTWFLELYRNAYEQYYRTNRLRYKLADRKMSIQVLVQLFCLTHHEMNTLSQRYVLYEEGEGYTLKGYGHFIQEFDILKTYLKVFEYGLSKIYTKERITYGIIR